MLDAADRDTRLVLMLLLDEPGPWTHGRLGHALGLDVEPAVGTLAASALVRLDGERVTPTPAARLADRLLGGTV